MQASTVDHQLAKPVRAVLPPAKVWSGAGRAGHGVVRGCPLDTGRDCCEWHASGTASEATRYRVVPLAPTLTVGCGPVGVPAVVLDCHRMLGQLA
jgi:hypothetical protein